MKIIKDKLDVISYATQEVEKGNTFIVTKLFYTRRSKITVLVLLFIRTLTYLYDR